MIEAEGTAVFMVTGKLKKMEDQFQEIDKTAQKFKVIEKKN